MSHAVQPTLPPPPEGPIVYPQRRAVLWGAKALGYLVYAYLVLTQIVLGLGFILLLFGANPEPAFVQWAYRSLDRAMEQFRGIFTSIELGQTGNDVAAVLDVSILFAMVVYAIIAWIIHAGVAWLAARITRLDREDQQYQRDLQRYQEQVFQEQKLRERSS
ncbi:hypothetical protein SAMN05192575_103203 [Nocardioides alpinus]|uniref:YggT family protein n=1 Tax=Nocardioides alpinus TaxID=748909 RepID=A0A1I0Y2P1_9ACTN|nr:hypothetical protein [Nocardioides alpinus]PKH42693.1 hypothetical protein CXG46_05340 [Nocardioides alpinus]SFB07452.1 hypothetical protein SAMN05192575_103203 [Nocardioides alpinus]